MSDSLEKLSTIELKQIWLKSKLSVLLHDLNNKSNKVSDKYIWKELKECLSLAKEIKNESDE